MHRDGAVHGSGGDRKRCASAYAFEMTMLQRDMKTISGIAHVSDDQLLADVKRLAADERQATAALVACLAELDARRLYLGEGCASLFTYCTQVLHLSEHAAYGRIEAARAARRFPVILDLLAAGAVTLTAISLLAPHLTPDNYRDTLEAARYKSKRDVEHLVAALRPQPAVPPSVRKLPAPKPADPSLSTARVEPRGADGAHTTRVARQRLRQTKAFVHREPTAPAQYKVQLTVSGETYEKLRRAQDLLRHTIPNGDPAAISIAR